MIGLSWFFSYSYHANLKKVNYDFIVIITIRDTAVSLSSIRALLLISAGEKKQEIAYDMAAQQQAAATEETAPGEVRLCDSLLTVSLGSTGGHPISSFNLMISDVMT